MSLAVPTGGSIIVHVVLVSELGVRVERHLAHAVQVSVFRSSSGHLGSLGHLRNPQSLLLLAKDEPAPELWLSPVESLHLYLHESKALPDEREVDASRGAKHYFVLSSCSQDHGYVPGDVLQLFREGHCPIFNPDEIDPSIHLSANDVIFVKLFDAENVGVKTHDHVDFEGLGI